MKTPWNKLVDYGVGFAAIVVMCIAGIVVLTAIAAAVLLSKLFVFIK